MRPRLAAFRARPLQTRLAGRGLTRGEEIARAVKRRTGTALKSRGCGTKEAVSIRLFRASRPCGSVRALENRGKVSARPATRSIAEDSGRGRAVGTRRRS